MLFEAAVTERLDAAPLVDERRETARLELDDALVVGGMRIHAKLLSRELNTVVSMWTAPAVSAKVSFSPMRTYG